MRKLTLTICALALAGCTTTQPETVGVETPITCQEGVGAIKPWYFNQRKGAPQSFAGHYCKAMEGKVPPENMQCFAKNIGPLTDGFYDGVQKSGKYYNPQQRRNTLKNLFSIMAHHCDTGEPLKSILARLKGRKA